jgi:hypothetical protein
MFTWANGAHVLFGGLVWVLLSQVPSPWGPLLTAAYILMRIVLAVRAIVRMRYKHKERMAIIQLRMLELQLGAPPSVLPCVENRQRWLQTLRRWWLRRRRR